jgi:hypothetical protein
VFSNNVLQWRENVDFTMAKQKSEPLKRLFRFGTYRRLGATVRSCEAGYRPIIHESDGFFTYFGDFFWWDEKSGFLKFEVFRSSLKVLSGK